VVSPFLTLATTLGSGQVAVLSPLEDEVRHLATATDSRRQECAPLRAPKIREAFLCR